MADETGYDLLLRAEIQDICAKLRTLANNQATEIASLRTRLVEVEEALKPFALEASKYDFYSKRDTVSVSVKVSDLREARMIALRPITSPGEPK